VREKCAHGERGARKLRISRQNKLSIEKIDILVDLAESQSENCADIETKRREVEGQAYLDALVSGGNRTAISA